ncbi:MAG TPA: RnfABCDGE type electron transport complex subunit D [Patescibacteria group bacterium]|jgi:ferredoxin-NADP reductase|nr:RnfABCDGE type electron transport complex subunit D [Patescibacteria group bacterium]
MNLIDKFLNDITMYRLIVYGLLAIIGAAFVLSAQHSLGYPIIALLGSAGTLLAVGYACHWVLVRIFASAPSKESWLVTVLILFLILGPAQSLSEYSTLALGIILAMTSKYIFTFARRHIFNPIAIALLALDLLGSTQVFWWVGSESLFPVVAIVGFLIVRKVRRYDMVVPFLVVAMTTYLIRTGVSTESLKSIVLSGPLIFFATIMLTEPQTSPHTRRLRIFFSTIVGLLFGVSFAFPPLYSTPELALVIGNIFAFAVSSKQRLWLTFQNSSLQGTGIYEFSFRPDRQFKFTPGQYLEWTLPHRHTDNRGNRRFFTIASSPTEQDVKIAVRIDPQHSSSFKRALLNMRPGEAIWVSQLSGDFILPADSSKRVVLIAGGIGITPFRSMVRQLVDIGGQRPMTLYYMSNSSSGFSYWQVFNQAMQNGVYPYYVLTSKDIPKEWTGKTGILTEDIIKSEVPDYKQAIFLLSGPHAMVDGYKKMLRKANVPRKHIMTDYFPGF